MTDRRIRWKAEADFSDVDKAARKTKHEIEELAAAEKLLARQNKELAREQAQQAREQREASKVQIAAAKEQAKEARESTRVQVAAARELAREQAKQARDQEKADREASSRARTLEREQAARVKDQEKQANVLAATMAKLNAARERQAESERKDFIASRMSERAHATTLETLARLTQANRDLATGHEANADSMRHVEESSIGLERATDRLTTAQTRHNHVLEDSTSSDKDKARSLLGVRSATVGLERAISAHSAATKRHGESTARLGHRTDDLRNKLSKADREAKNGKLAYSLARFEAGFKGVAGAAGKAVGVLMVMKLPTIAAGIGQLVPLVLQLAAGLYSMAGALAPAVGLLGMIPAAALGAGAAIGSLLAAFKGVGAALKAYGTQRKADAKKGAKAAIDEARAAMMRARAIRDATWGVSDALKAERAAQLAITQARKDAQRQLEDNLRTLRDVRNAERGAGQSLEEAQANLTRTMNDTGSTDLGRREAQLAVEEAQANLSDAKLASKDAGDAQFKAAKKGVEGSEIVVSAKEAELQSSRGLIHANEALADALAASSKETLAAAEAVNVFDEAMKDLSPSQKKFVNFLIGLKPKIKDLKEIAAKNLLPGVQKGIESLLPLLPAVKKTLGGTSKILGNFVADVGRRLGSIEGKGIVSRIFDSNERALSDYTAAGGSLVTVLARIGDAARPLVEWIAGLTRKWAESKEALTAGESGRAKLEAFFARTKTTLQVVGRILGATWRAFGNITEAGREAGDTLLRLWAEASEKFEAWTASLGGQSALKSYFDKSVPVLAEVGRLLAAIVQTLFQVGNSVNLVPLIRTLRTDLLPLLGKIFDNFARSGVLEEAVGMFVSFGRILAKITEDTSGFATFMGVLGDFMEAISWLVVHTPGASGVLAFLLTKFALFKAMALVDSILGLRAVFGVLFADIIAGAGRGGKALDGIRLKWMAMSTAMKAGVGLAALAAVGFFAAAMTNAKATIIPAVEQITAAVLKMNDSAGGTASVDKLFDDLYVDEEYTDSIDDISSAFKRLTDKDWKQKVNDSIGDFFNEKHEAHQASAVFEQIGESLANLVSGGNADMAAKQFETMAAKLGLSGPATQQLLDLMPAYKESLAGMGNEATIAGTKVKKAEAPTKSFTERLEDTKTEAEAARTALQELANEAEGYGNSVEEASGATIEYNSALRDAQAMVKENAANHVSAALKNKSAFDLTTEAGGRAQQAMQGIADTSLTSIRINGEQGASLAEVTTQVDKSRAAFIKQATDMGLSQGAAETLATKLGLTRTNVKNLHESSAKPKIDADPKAANEKITATQARLAALELEKVVLTILVEVEASAMEAFETYLSDLETKTGFKFTPEARTAAAAHHKADVAAKIASYSRGHGKIGDIPAFKPTKAEIAAYARYLADNPDAHADGGLISGPGTGTSDSISARLSDGEYVVKAAAVKKYGTGFLQRVNQMRLAGGGLVRKFAGGGPVSGAPAAAHSQSDTPAALPSTAATVASILGMAELIGPAVRDAWEVWIQPALQAFVAYMNDALGPKVTWLAATCETAFVGLGAGVSRSWTGSIQPTLLAFGGFLGSTVAPLIASGVTAIGTAWDKLKALTAEPANFVINTVLNDGLFKAFNDAAKAVDAKLPVLHAEPIKLATGGTVPGVGSGDTVPAMLTPGEYVVNKRAARRLGGTTLRALNNGEMPHFAQGGLVGFGRELQRRKFQVGEHPLFGGVSPTAHAPGGQHYNRSGPGGGGAIDVNKGAGQSPAEMAAIDGIVGLAKSYGLRTLWRIKDHFDHAHFDIGAGGDMTGAGVGSGAAAAGGDETSLLASMTAASKVTGGAIGKALAKVPEKLVPAMAAKLSELGLTASGDTGPVGGASTAGNEANKALGKTMAAAKGWTGSNWQALAQLWSKESGWNERADNPSSDAYGIPQSLPGSKMASAGADWATNPATQIKWGLGYIKDRYGDPSAAWAHSVKNNWYAAGGGVPGTGSGDTVPAMLTPGEFVIRKQSAARIGLANLHRMNDAQHFAKGGEVKRRTLREGMRGADVSAVQKAAGIKPQDGIYGPKTTAAVREYQTKHKLGVDGVVGSGTWAAIDGKGVGKGVGKAAGEAVSKALLKLGSTGSMVKRLQARVGGKAERGVFGPLTQDAVRRFQSASKLKSTGQVDAATWKAVLAPRKKRRLLRLGNRGTDVSFVQRALGLAPDGVFGVPTMNAVKRFQRSKKFKQDGVVGPQTYKALKAKLAASDAAAKKAADARKPIAAIDDAIKEQQRANGLQQEFNGHLDTFAKWGFTNSVDKLLELGPADGMEIARAGAKNRAYAETYEKAMTSAKEIRETSNAESTQFVAAMNAPAGSKPGGPESLAPPSPGPAEAGIRWLAQTMQIPDYSVVQTYDRLVKAGRIPANTGKLSRDIAQYRAGTFYAAQGGEVPGTGTGDVAPAMLTPGEFVLRKAAVKALGLDRLTAMNKVQHFAAGGPVFSPNVPGLPGISAAGTASASRGIAGAGSNVVNITTTIHNPVRERGTQSMNKLLRRKAATGAFGDGASVFEEAN